jgi:hypothetical protein
VEGVFCEVRLIGLLIEVRPYGVFRNSPPAG